jgi:heptosyltransferase-3
MRRSSRLGEVPKAVLVIALRYLGDLLLTTPLFHSIRKAYPDCQLDVLVSQGTAGILEGNPYINTIIQTPERKNVSEEIKLLRCLFRKYDVAFVTQTGGRPLFYSLVAASIRVAAVVPKKSRGWWKRFLVRYWEEFDDMDTHTVQQNLNLIRLIGIEAFPKVILPRGPVAYVPLKTNLNKRDYAVLHMYPQRRYKRWTNEGWRAVGHFLGTQNVRLILSGSLAKKEVEYIQNIRSRLPEDTINLAGKLSLAELAEIIRGACLFIGPDTSVTHMAAATGVPVVALFGPTNPVKWAPGPINFSGEANPFSKQGSQDVGNVHLIQGVAHCVPCHLEGCERLRNSYSDCLDTLPPSRVIKKIRQIMVPQVQGSTAINDSERIGDS